MKKANGFLFFISLLIFFFATACNQQLKKSEANSVSQPETANANAPLPQSAEKLYERLMVSFSNDWVERESDPDLYPNFYGGSFVDKDGTFVIAVTANRDENKKRLAEILGTDNFKVEAVQYSYRQMMQVMDSIDAFLMNSTIPEDHPLVTSFAGAYPDVTENRVKVLLTKTDDASIRLFKKDVIDSPLVIFVQGELPEY